MNSRVQRKMEIVRRIAQQAYSQPLLDSGLWFHNDIRNNFYYASYLFAAASAPDAQLPFDKTEAAALACRVLTELLELQNRDPDSPMYGHWPLGLEPNPRGAEPNTLPVELMGSLLMYFFQSFESKLPEELQQSLRLSLRHIYEGGFFRKPLREYNHHEAKYTAAKLIFGQWFEDGELLEDGRLSLKQTLEHVQTQGMSEYGCLPWFWHWVQAFNCAWELIRRPDIRTDLRAMLDFLWTERSLYYLKGTWAGPHSRGLAHDIPKDSNVVFDYVQFGDFELPPYIQRVEYAGFLSYEAPEEARSTALDRSVPAEVKRVVKKQTESGEVCLHKYAYMTQSYALGGVVERFREYDNEQHRWDVTFPLHHHESVNQLFFFIPGYGFSDGDPRHQSDAGEVVFDRNVAMALYPLPEGSGKRMVGILPKAQWRLEEKALFGQIGSDVYAAVFMPKAYTVMGEADRFTLYGEPGDNGVVVEVVSTNEARAAGIGSFDAFVLSMKANAPQFSCGLKPTVQYRSLLGKQLSLNS